MFESAKNGLIRLGGLLPFRVRAALFHYARNCAPEEFERFSFLYPPGSAENLRAIAARGLSPKVVVDVGAFEGSWSKTVSAIWPGCRITMIEPNPSKRATLTALARELGATLVTELLGAEDGREVSFQLMETGSSVFPENSDVPRKAQMFRMRTLDSILAEQSPVDLLKIDAQGYELEILAGAQRTLQGVEAVILEVSLLEINQGCPLLDEVIRYMRTRNFVAYDVLELHRRPFDHALFQIDVLFCRMDSALRADKRLR